MPANDEGHCPTFLRKLHNFTVGRFHLKIMDWQTIL